MLPDADLLWVSFSLGAELTNCFQGGLVAE
jgi:hypothetical protein